jgi:glycosyltransferase involved in cell wall biosynthesis
MNIAIDIRCLMERELTGVGEYTFNLLKHLFETDNTNEYFLFYNSRQDVSKYIPKFPKNNIHYCAFHWPNKLLNLSIKFLKYPKLDLWIQKKYQTPPIDLFFFPNICSLNVSCPYLLTAHDLSFEFFSEFLSIKRRLWHLFVKPEQLFNKAERIIAVSKNTKQDLVNRYRIDPSKIQIVYSGLSTNYKILPTDDVRMRKVKQKYSLPEKFALFIGTIEPRKNLDGLISAFKLFNQNHPGYSLVIAGKLGWKYKEILNSIQLTENVKFVNFIKDSEKRYFYNLASMFVYPSFYEGFGFPPLEAMACGCPVITSSNSSLSEICGEAAMLIDPCNINDLSEATKLMTIKSNADYWRALGLKKSKNFSWYKTAYELLLLFHKN